MMSDPNMTAEEHAYWESAASRQAEIDCLKVELDAANERAMMLLDHKNKMVDKLQGEVDELQKRIDEALKAFKSDLSEIGKFNTIHKILKGKENEN